MTDRLAANEAGLDRAAALLQAGQLVAFPTDTVYGVGCALSHPEAVDDIYALKRRPTDRLIPSWSTHWSPSGLSGQWTIGPGPWHPPSGLAL